jgi:8-oxo-dGTP pyrophosphatase MutT (NUDIX family)
VTEHTPLPIESPGINVAAVARTNEGWKFLLLRRAPRETYPGFWGLLTGTRENNESVPDLAVRELKEEVALQPLELWASEYCVQFFEPMYDGIWILPVIVALVDFSETITLSEENAEYRWTDVGEAVELVPWQNLKDILPRLQRELDEYPAPNWVRLPIGSS